MTQGIRCTSCNGATEVLDSRTTTDNSVRRRRECVKCGVRMTSYEYTSQDLDKKFEDVKTVFSTLKELMQRFKI